MTESLKNYRNAIRQAWLPLVGRNQLTSSEYAQTEQWFNESIPVQLILRAIASVAARSVVVFSIGVIKADLVALQREQGRLQAGAHKEEIMQDDWRNQWEQDLKALAEEYPEISGDCFDLMWDLPKLTEDEAKARWQEISK
jgi:hypothetical protein